MNPVEQYLSGRLEERRAEGNLRVLTAAAGRVDFFSNDYLGFATTDVVNNCLQQLSPHLLPTGSTGSRLLSGNSMQAEALECSIARFHKAEAALLFNSGYSANTGLISSIVGRSTTILYDEYCHASIIDGIRLSLCARKFRFRHNDTEGLERKLEQYRGSGPVLVIVESVYSMDGDLAPLARISELCDRYGAQLIVDEAHATGVIGRNGEGLVCNLGLHDSVFARVHTFGKALGCHGAAVVGSKLLKEYLVNYSRPFIYTTALPGHAIQAIQCAYMLLAADSFSNERLHQLIAYFRERLKELNIGEWVDSPSAIQAVIAGDNDKARRWADALQRSGLQVNPIFHPTVPKGKERLRICLHSFNTTQQINTLFDVLRKEQ